MNESVKKFLITFFFGWFGVHKFMEGKIGMGILYCITGGLYGIGWLVDVIKAFIKMLNGDSEFTEEVMALLNQIGSLDDCRIPDTFFNIYRNIEMRLNMMINKYPSKSREILEIQRSFYQGQEQTIGGLIYRYAEDTEQKLAYTYDQSERTYLAANYRHAFSRYMSYMTENNRAHLETCHQDLLAMVEERTAAGIELPVMEYQKVN